MPDLSRIGDRVTRELVKAMVAGRHEVVSQLLIPPNPNPNPKWLVSC